MTVPDHADALVIGAGLSGAVVAHRLARTGIAVTCIEQGRWHDREDYRGRSDDWELAALGPWHASPNVRAAPEDYPVVETDAEMKTLMFNGVGGSTILYGAHWMRMLPSDFRVRTLDGVADDWPIGYGDLAPYYDRVDRAFGASGIAGDPAYPSRADYPMPPLPIGAWGERVARAHHRLGWHWWPGSNAIASRDYDGRRPCVQRSTCGQGCNEGAKGSVDQTHWPAALENGARLIADTRVKRLVSDADGRIAGAIVAGDNGAERRITCDIAILAANAIGTPRLMLTSAGPRHERGLCNGSGCVGKYLMMHPFTRVVGFFDEPLESTQGHWGQSLYSMEYAETDASRGFVRGAKWNLTPSGGPLHAALFPWPGERRWGSTVHGHVAKWLGRSAIWGISCEDLPEPENAVTLDDGLTDGDGVPAARITYTVSDNAHAMLRFNAEHARQSLQEAGAYETVSQPLMPEFGWHPLGTCRMGDDPETSVVGADCRAHEADNLFIVDGSTFVTGSCVNPSATIAAIALRAADRIVDNRRSVH